MFKLNIKIPLQAPQIRLPPIWPSFMVLGKVFIIGTFSKNWINMIHFVKLCHQQFFPSKGALKNIQIFNIRMTSRPSLQERILSRLKCFYKCKFIKLQLFHVSTLCKFKGCQSIIQDVTSTATQESTRSTFS